MGRLRNKRQRLGRSWRRRICQNCTREDAIERMWSPVPGLGNRSCHWLLTGDVHCHRFWKALQFAACVFALFAPNYSLRENIQLIEFQWSAIVKCQELGRTSLSFSQRVSSNTRSPARTVALFLELSDLSNYRH